MSELRDFVADLMERKGAIVEVLGPDALAVLAPAPVRTQMGWPELAQLGFGTERPHGAIAIGLEGDWLDRFGALLEDKGRWSEREVRLTAVAAPGDPERVLERVLDLPNAVWRFQGMSAATDTLRHAGVPLHRRFGREARGTDLARLQSRHRRGRHRHPGAAAAGAGADGRVARARSVDAARGRPRMERGDASGRARSAARPAGARQLEPFLRAMRRRLERDRNRVHAYHDDLRGASLKRLVALAQAKESGPRPTGGARRFGSRRSSANTAPSSTTCAATMRCASLSNGCRRWISTCRCSASTY